MFFAIILGVVFSVIHFVLQFPPQASIVVAGLLTVVLWGLWKLRWIVLGILGLEMLFGGGDGGGENA